MLSSFRRLSKSTVGSLILVLFLLLIVASFTLTDISNVGGGSFGQSGSTLASVGDEEITDRDLSRAMERRLGEIRQTNPEADYSTIAADFDPILASLIDERTLRAFANEHGFTVSKRLVDAEIANIPAAKGLGGRFSQEAYQNFLAQQRLTDQEVRSLLAGGLLERLLLTPLASSGRVPVGVARPYASMLLEARQGEVLNIPVSAFRAALKPSDADLQRFYAENRVRYMVPEQRVLRLARIGPEQVAGVTATEQDIAAYYNANQATYGAKDIRVISQAVVPDRNTANAIAQRARAGGSFAAAAAPAGLTTEDISVGPQTRSEFTSLAGDRVAKAAFGAQQGAVVGPLQSDLGWHVVKIDEVRRQGGKSLTEARAEIAAKLNAEKRSAALTDLVTRVEDAIGGGSNFEEAAAMAKLSVTQTPLITGSGVARGDPSYRFPQELAAALKSGFELAPNDEPMVETLPGEAGYVLVAPAQVVPAAPAPLASIRAQVVEDWTNAQALSRARAVATRIAASVARNVPLAQAAREAGASLPPVRPLASRRIDLGQLGPNIPPAVRMLFSLGQGKSRMVADPQGRGFSVVKVNRIVPGNALNQPALISQVQQEFQQQVGQEYVRQFLNAARGSLGLKRNEQAIAATKRRITGS